MVVAGQSAALIGDRFVYTACVVPNLKRKTLKTDRRRLKKAGCKLGKVKGSGKQVTKQSIKPGTVRPLGSKVSVTTS